VARNSDSVFRHFNCSLAQCAGAVARPRAVGVLGGVGGLGNVHSVSASAKVYLAAASTSGSLGTSSKHLHIPARDLICRTFRSFAFQR
jgi:hypothetical protein